MEQNKTSRYLKYAIGEIILVVIGILIALQINNWNQRQQDKRIEKATLKALLSEFKDNRAAIKVCLDEIKDFRADGDSLRRYIGPELANLSKDSLNKMLGDVGSTSRCVVATDVLGDVQSSGKLNLIGNEEVRRAISRWSSQLKDLQGEEHDWVQEFSNQFVPYANKWIQWEDVDYLYHTKDTVRYYPSRFEVDPRLMLQQPEFANIMGIQYWRIMRIELKTNALLRDTDALVLKLENELKD